MEKLTYKQAYDKIIEAYFKDEIEPGDVEFCFCGTLSHDKNWHLKNRNKKVYTYSLKEYSEMEYALLKPMGCDRLHNSPASWGIPGNVLAKVDDYENMLFTGMCAALDVLKQIHIERGEIIDEVPEFKKRLTQSQGT